MRYTTEAIRVAHEVGGVLSKEERMGMRCGFGWVIAACLCGGVCLLGGEALQEAAALKKEAMAILEKASASSTDPKAYASAMLKLEQAQRLLEQAKADDSPLAQEVTAALFWARKFSNVQSVGEVERLRGTGGPVASTNTPPEPKKTDPDPPTTPTGMESGASAAQLATAKKKFEEAERFAKEQAANDFIVALRWFQVADEVSGTDYSVKALSKARAAQERYAAKSAADPASAASTKTQEGPAFDLIKEGDRLLAQDKSDEAAEKYEASIKLNESTLAHRKLGHVYFDRAQAMKDELLPKFDAQLQEYRNALKAATRVVTLRRGGSYKQVDWTNPRLVAAKKEGAELTLKGREAIGYYDRAALEFSKVLTAEKKDLDAAAHQALCYSVRGDNNSRARARIMIVAMLQEYQPSNDMERTVYEFCKTELKRITPRR